MADVVRLGHPVPTKATIFYYQPDSAPVPTTIQLPWEGMDTLPGRPALRARLKEMAGDLLIDAVWVRKPDGGLEEFFPTASASE